MADQRDLVDACFTCGTIWAHKNKVDWQGGDWGKPCKSCGSPVSVVPRDRAKQAIERERAKAFPPDAS